MPSHVNVSKAAPKANPTLRRKDVPQGKCFVVKGGRKVYAALGQRTIPPSNEKRWESMNIKTGENASTANGNSQVEVVGDYELTVNLNARGQEVFARM